MTDPAELIEVEVPPETVLAGDLLVDAGDDEVTGSPEEDEHAPEHLAIPVRTGGRALVPRTVLVRVRRRRTDAPNARPAPTGAIEQQLAEVRDLALALAEQVGPGAPAGRSLDAALDRTARARDRVRARLEQEPSPDGTDRPDAEPEPAPVLGVAPAVEPPAAAPAVEPAVDDGAPTVQGAPVPPDRRGPRRDR